MDEVKVQDPGTTEGPREIKKAGLHWRIPDSAEEGYLKRAKLSLRYRQEFKQTVKDKDLSQEELSPEALDALVKYLSVNVMEPDGSPEEKIQALEDHVSEDDMAQMLEWSFPELFKDEEDPDQVDPLEGVEFSTPQS